MNPAIPAPAARLTLGQEKRRLKGLCRGDAGVLEEWILQAGWRGVLTCCAVIILGTGLYGYTVGLWRDPLQAVYTAIKLPLMILLTCAGNALLNGIFGLILGAGLTFRQSTLSILMSFTLIAIILGAFSPISLFILYNAPPLTSGQRSDGHSLMLLSHVALIGYAGVVGNVRLFRLLEHLSGDRAPALRVLVAWLLGNALLGTQLSWILRPFIGSPQLPVQFFRADPLNGSFLEAVWRSLVLLFSS